MKDAEDEAFDELAKRQGDWGGGFPAKRRMTADKQHWDEEQWNKNNWRCGHGWLRGEQCEICNAPQRPWVGLTDEEIHGTAGYNETRETYQFALAIQAKLKERNHEH